MALDPGSATGTSIDATTVTNGATVTINQCGLIVNADGGKAWTLPAARCWPRSRFRSLARSA